MSQSDYKVARRADDRELARNKRLLSRDGLEWLRTVTKAKSDPIWFMTNILGVKLFPMQEEILRTFYRSRYDRSFDQFKRLIIVAGMRGGKTALASMMGCYEFFDTITLDDPAAHYGLLRKQPIFLSCVATSEKQADDGVYSNMQNMIEASDWFHTWFDIGISGDRISCDAKHVAIQILSSWANTAVGRSNRCVIFDELANFEDTQGRRGAWEIWSRLIKSTDTFGYDGHVIGISSPRRPDDIIMTLLKQSMECQQLRGPKCRQLAYKIPTWQMNPNLTEAGLREEHGKDLGTFYRDYACEPEMWSGVQFPEGIVLTQITNVLKDNTLKSPYPHILTMDPSAKNDSFGMGSAYILPNGHIVVDGVTKFQKTEGSSYISPTDIYDALNSAIPRLNVTHLIYDIWMYLDTMDRLHQKYGTELVMHQVTKTDYDTWRDLQSNPERPLSVVYDSDLKMEAEMLIVKKGNTRDKVDHPATGSKDVADCVANAIWFYKGNPEVVQPSMQMIYVNVV